MRQFGLDGSRGYEMNCFQGSKVPYQENLGKALLGLLQHLPE